MWGALTALGGASNLWDCIANSFVKYWEVTPTDPAGDQQSQFRARVQLTQGEGDVGGPIDAAKASDGTVYEGRRLVPSLSTPHPLGRSKCCMALRTAHRREFLAKLGVCALNLPSR
jgi:hypothetical protein